jgi:hypothetical protein
MLMVNRLLPIQGFMGHPLPTKMTSRWKLENGQWCYYVDPQTGLASPLPSARLRLPAWPFPTAEGRPARRGHRARCRPCLRPLRIPAC